MTTPNLNTVTQSYKVGRGSLLFALRNDDGSYDGYRRLGNAPGFTVNIESENLTHESSETGLAERDLDIPLRITRSGTITIDNLNAENLGIFLGATVEDLSQTSTSVTNEAVSSIKPERAYQLGGLVGVRGISGVSVDVNATARANSTAYAVGDIYAPATPNNHIYICTVAGTSDAAPPTFTTNGSTFTDGTATFKDIGTISPLVSGTDYLIDLDLGLLSIPATGKLATAYANAAAAVTDLSLWSIDLHVDYTRPARTIQQIATGSGATIRGRLKFVSANPTGEQQDVLIPDATLSPNGELPWITADEVASVELTVGINKLDSNTPALYVHGRAVA